MWSTVAECECAPVVQVVIFVKSVHRCVALAQLLVEQNFPAIAIHRGMPQEERYPSPNNKQHHSHLIIRLSLRLFHFSQPDVFMFSFILTNHY